MRVHSIRPSLIILFLSTSTTLWAQNTNEAWELQEEPPTHEDD